MDNTQTEFDQAYWASQPPEIRALRAIDGDRSTRGAELARKGFTIDVPIMVWNWDAYLVMKQREQYGYTWVPSALQPAVNMAPGISNTLGDPYDPNHPPPGSIHVSTDVSAYPPYEKPTPVSDVAPANPVGLQSVGDIYLPVRGELYEDGQTYQDARGEFLKHVNLTPFGRMMYWQRIGDAK